MKEKKEVPIELWNDLYLTIGISFGIATMEGKLLYSFPGELRNMIDPQLYEFCAMEIKKHNIINDVMIYFISDFYYCIICPLDDSLFLVSVPVSMQKVNVLPLNFIHHFVKSDQKTAFLTLICNTHSVFQASRFANLVKSVYSSNNIRKIVMLEHIAPVSKSQLENEENRFKSEDDLFEEPMKANNPSLFIEKEVQEAIINGDSYTCLQALNRRFSGDYGHMSNDSIQQQKYEFVIRLYVFTHAAIKGGVNSEFALRLSDHYCRRLDTMKTVKSINSLELAAVTEYCNLVKKNKDLPKLTKEVSNCYDYIIRHLYEPIQLKDIENIMNMNRKNLNIHFKREMGMTISECIVKKRLEEAKYLLHATDISISDISTLLCFSNQSHFTKRFKEKYQITPKQYREQNLN